MLLLPSLFRLESWLWRTLLAFALSVGIMAMANTARRRSFGWNHGYGEHCSPSLFRFASELWRTRWRFSAEARRRVVGVETKKARRRSVMLLRSYGERRGRFSAEARNWGVVWGRNKKARRRSVMLLRSYGERRWSWRESNPRANKEVKGFLHAYFVIPLSTSTWEQTPQY